MFEVIDNVVNTKQEKIEKNQPKLFVNKISTTDKPITFESHILNSENRNSNESDLKYGIRQCLMVQFFK